MKKLMPFATLTVLSCLVASSLFAYVLLSPRRTWDSPPNLIIDNRGLASVADGDLGRTRTRKKIFLGNGGDKELTLAIRAQGNLLELTPLILLLLLMLHGPMGHRLPDILAILLVIARFLHAGGLLGYVPYGRVTVAIGTTVILAVAAVALLLAGLRAL